MARKLCIICGIRKGTGDNGKDFSDMCDPCYQEAGWENTHSDGDHDSIIAGTVVYGMTTHKTRAAFETWLKEEREGCWICFPELNLAKAPAKATTAKKQGVRRVQLNHKGHSHVATSAARRACKDAFWAWAGGAANVASADQLALAMQEWDTTFDGKTATRKVAAPKVTPMTVVPRGPKGGVINQLKASKPMKKVPLHPATPGSYALVQE